MPRSSKPGWIDWVNSAAREIILEDLLPGGYLFGKNDMPASAAWNYYRNMAEFKGPPVVFDQFEARLKDHRKQASKRLEISRNERKMMQHDRNIYPEEHQNHRGELVFSRHPAQKHLRADIKASRHKSMTPMQLHASRPEYQDFKLGVFKQRISQEIRRQKFVYYLEDKQFEKRRQYSEEVAKKKEQEEAKKRKMAEKEAQKVQQEEAKKKRREEAKKRKMAEKEAQKVQQEEAKKRRLAEKVARKKEQEEAKKRKMAEKAAKKKEAKKRRIA